MAARHLETIMRIIRVGILGAAKIAPKAVIVPARDNPEFEIVAVAARDKDRAKAFAAENGIPFVADSYPALVARGRRSCLRGVTPGRSQIMVHRGGEIGQGRAMRKAVRHDGG